MYKIILDEAYQQIINDPKIIKLATITSISYSLIFVLYIFYQTYVITISFQWQSLNIDQIQNFFMTNFTNNYVFFVFIWVLIFWLIGYFLMPPIWQATLIYYLNDENKKWTDSLWKWFYKFFPLFELNSLISVFNYFAFLIAFSRVVVLWIYDNILIIIIMSIWLFVIVVISFLLPYTKFLIILDDKTITDAIWDSIRLTLTNFNFTRKFVILNYILYIRFFINIILLVWIPIFLIYISIKFNFFDNEIFVYMIYISLFLIVCFVAYINSIIEAFFITYWFKVFNFIKNKNQ